MSRILSDHPQVAVRRFRSASARGMIVAVTRSRAVSAALCLVSALAFGACSGDDPEPRSEEHTSELQSLMRISYAVFCLKNKIQDRTHTKTDPNKLTPNQTNIQSTK